jgi:uncharacterized protein (TIGR03437 family)
MQRPLATLLFLASLATAQTTRDNNWRTDLDLLATQLPRLHANLFYYTPRSVFDEAVAELRNDIPSLTDVEVIVRMSAIVALAHDGHTALSFGAKVSTFRLLPLQFFWFDDGLFIVGASTDYARAAGAKVLRIGNRSADEAYAALKPIISYENDIWARYQSPGYLRIADILQALGIANSNADVLFQLQDSSGAVFTMDVATAGAGQPGAIIPQPNAATGFQPLYLQNSALNYWFTYVESSRTLYFAYNVCEEMASLPFARFNDQLWAAFDSKPVDRLVIDLRNNGGGNSAVINPFLASAEARAARFDSARVVLVIGRHTFSSGVLAAITLHVGPVVAYGEPTGGSPNSYGEVQSFTLPNSQLTVSYSTKLFSFPSLPPGSLAPDVQAPNLSSDYFARHDPFLAAVLADAAPAPPAGTLPVVNAASFHGPVAPGSIASAFGDWPDPAGAVVEVTVNGAPANVLAATHGQVNFVVPGATSPGMATIRIASGGAALAEGTAPVAATAPGVFAAGVRDGVIELYGTGQGAAADPRVYVGADEAEVLYSGAHPVFPGLWQVNARVPASVAGGQSPVFVTAGRAASNGVAVHF